MEEQKIDKRSKAYKDSIKEVVGAQEQVAIAANGCGMQPKTLGYTPLEQLINYCIPVSKAEFQSAVNNSDGVPENLFAENHDKPNRKVKMWLAPGGGFLICQHKGKYFATPTANVKYWNFKS